MNMHKVAEQAIASRQEAGGIKQIIFVACGGSLAAFYPAKFLLEKESKELRIGYHTANEFVHATPKSVGPNSLVIACSHRGNTPETVAAIKIGRERGAATIAFTYSPGSEITAYGDQVVTYSYGPEVVYSEKKEALGLRLAMELLHQLEGWELYQPAMCSFDRFDRVVREAREQSLSAAKSFAEANSTEALIYTVGSGASYGAAYIECMCILLEMQWIHSGPIHAGEFFHGALEITDSNTPFLLLMGDGSTRDLDERAQAFLERWGKKIYVVDVKDLGINCLDDAVAEYFSPLLLTAVLDVYNKELAETRQHPLSTRRYMWKVQY